MIAYLGGFLFISLIIAFLDFGHCRAFGNNTRLRPVDFTTRWMNKCAVFWLI